MAQKITLTASDGSKIVLEALGVLSNEDLERERAALAEALEEAEQAKIAYEQGLQTITDLASLSSQIENAKNDILNALPDEASEQDIDNIFNEESSSTSEEA